MVRAAAEIANIFEEAALSLYIAHGIHNNHYHVQHVKYIERWNLRGTMLVYFMVRDMTSSFRSGQVK